MKNIFVIIVGIIMCSVSIPVHGKVMDVYYFNVEHINGIIKNPTKEHRSPVLVSSIQALYDTENNTLSLSFRYASDCSEIRIEKDGNVMMSETVSIDEGTTIIYDMSGYETGDYHVIVTNEDGTQYIGVLHII